MDGFQDELFPEAGQPAEGWFDAQLALPLHFLPEPEPFVSIVKRDGRHEAFERNKIADTILLAAAEAGGLSGGTRTNAEGTPQANMDRARAESLAAAVTIYLLKRCGDKPPSADQVHDAVERVLIHMQQPETALSYARHRDRRARVRRLRAGDLKLLSSELDEAQRARDSLRAHGDRALFVRTSADTLAAWDRERIVEALMRETGLPEPLARMVALEVEEQIDKAGLRLLTSALVRELVGAKLIERGFEAHYARHRRLGLPLYDTERIVQGAAPDAVGCDPSATDRLLAGAAKKEYALAEVFPAEAADAHLRGEIHIHALDATDRLLGVEHALDYVAALGVELSEERFAEPPKHFDTLLAQWVKCTESLERHCSGQVAWDAVNFGIAPFLYGAPKPVLAQAAQMLVNEFAYRAMSRPGAPPAEITLAWNAPAWLAGREAVGPGGEPTDRVYEDYEHTAQELAWAIIESFFEGGPGSEPFAAPALRIQLSENTFRAPGGEAFLAHAGRLAAARRPVRFAFDRAPQHRHDEKEPWQPRHVFLQQVTLNLPRAAYAAAETDDWFAEIERALHVALRAHAAKRDFATRMMGRGAAGPWALLCRARDGRRYFDPHGAWCLIGVDGLYEAVNYLTRDIDDAGDAAHALGVRAITFLAERCFALGRKLDLRIALAPNNDRAVGARFAARDLEQFPQAVSFLDGRIPTDADVAYTPGVRLGPGAVSSPIERVRIEGLFHRGLRFGAQTEAPLPDGALSEHSLAGFLKKTWRQTQNRCIVFE